MQPDQVRAQDTKAWLDQAAKDLRRVEILLAASPPDVEGALFHAQQGAEKTLKGFLTWHDVRFRRVHDLDEIGKQCAEVDTTLAALMDRVAALTEYASRFRYPGAPYLPTLEQAEAAFSLARELTATIVGRLPEAAQP